MQYHRSVPHLSFQLAISSVATFNTDLKYRSRTEIVSSMLEAANGGATKTKIMYRAFLSHGQLKEYLPMLLERDLLSYEPKTQLLRTTEKGFQILTLHSQIEQLASGKREEEILQRSR